MPQLSLYIDDKTLKKIERAARKDKISLSKWVVLKINETFDKTWPKDYDKLFGAITDDTFLVSKIKDFATDHKREEL